MKKILNGKEVELSLEEIEEFNQLQITEEQLLQKAIDKKRAELKVYHNSEEVRTLNINNTGNTYKIFLYSMLIIIFSYNIFC